MFLLLKKIDNTLSNQMYRKSIHRYLYAKSHQHKNSQLSTHLYIVSLFDKEHLQIELNLKQALRRNGHVKKDIKKVINKHTSKTTNPNTQPSQDEIGKRIFSILLYVKGTTDHILAYWITTITSEPFSKKISNFWEILKIKDFYLVLHVQNTLLFRKITLRKSGEWLIYERISMWY